MQTDLTIREKKLSKKDESSMCLSNQHNHHKTKYEINPRIFLSEFCEVDHQYPTRFSQNSFYYKSSACKTTGFAITLRGPTIRNSFLTLFRMGLFGAAH